MGLRSLESFMEKRESIKCCRRINIRDLTIPTKANSKNVIVVDIKSCIYWIIDCANLYYVSGGQMKESVKIIKKFITCFKNVNIELVILVDGVVVPELIDSYIARKTANLKEVTNFLKNPNDIKRVPIWPNNLEDVILDEFKKHNIKILQSIGECDFEVAKYARDNNCIGVLAQDSDYMFFKFSQPYISMKHLDLNNMTSIIYDRYELASLVRLQVGDLYWLKIILETFEIDLKDSGDKWKFHKTANFIRKMKIENRLNSISLSTYYKVSDKEFQKVADGIAYDALYWNLKQFNKKALPLCENQNWNRILKKIEDLHTNHLFMGYIYSTIVMSKYVCGVMLEDYGADSLIPNQILLKKLRQKIYGILLIEKPRERVVEEYSICSYDSLKKPVLVMPIFPKRKHSGLISYWSDNHEYDTEKWDLFFEALNISSLRTLELHLIVPVASIIYLLNEGLEIKNWELKALISAIVIPKFMTAETLKALPFNINSRAIRIYTTVTKTFLTVLWLNNSLGFPIDKNMASTVNYQEGKLFQYIYHQYSITNTFDLGLLHLSQNNNVKKSIFEIRKIFKSFLL